MFTIEKENWYYNEEIDLKHRVNTLFHEVKKGNIHEIQATEVVAKLFVKALLGDNEPVSKNLFDRKDEDQGKLWRNKFRDDKRSSLGLAP